MVNELEPTVPFRLAPAEKDGDERLTYDVPELGQSLDARRRPGVCDARPLAMARAHADVAKPAQVPGISGRPQNCGRDVNRLRGMHMRINTRGQDRPDGRQGSKGQRMPGNSGCPTRRELEGTTCGCRRYFAIFVPSRH